MNVGNLFNTAACKLPGFKFSQFSWALKTDYMLPYRLTFALLAHKTTIQKGTAVLLLLVFLTSIAPKAFFHDLVANHEDLPDCRQFHQSIVLHQQTFNCHFDELVVTGPFVLSSEQVVILSNNYIVAKQACFYRSRIQAFFQQKENRGPPLV